MYALSYDAKDLEASSMALATTMLNIEFGRQLFNLDGTICNPDLPLRVFMHEGIHIRILQSRQGSIVCLFPIDSKACGVIVESVEDAIEQLYVTHKALFKRQLYYTASSFNGMVETQENTRMYTRAIYGPNYATSSKHTADSEWAILNESNIAHRMNGHHVQSAVHTATIVLYTKNQFVGEKLIHLETPLSPSAFTYGIHIEPFPHIRYIVGSGIEINSMYNLAYGSADRRYLAQRMPQNVIQFDYDIKTPLTNCVVCDEYLYGVVNIVYGDNVECYCSRCITLYKKQHVGYTFVDTATGFTNLGINKNEIRDNPTLRILLTYDMKRTTTDVIRALFRDVEREQLLMLHTSLVTTHRNRIDFGPYIGVPSAIHALCWLTDDISDKKIVVVDITN